MVLAVRVALAFASETDFEGRGVMSVSVGSPIVRMARGVCGPGADSMRLDGKGSLPEYSSAASRRKASVTLRVSCVVSFKH